MNLPGNPDLKNLSFDELEKLAGSLGIESYRAQQISLWIFQKNVACIDLMTNLSKETRSRLSESAFISFLEPEKIEFSRDGSKKFLFKTADGYGIESVLIPEKNHHTLCISTQIGCPLQCRFCFTGRHGLVRSLSAAEILNQVSAVIKEENFDGRLPNIVFMGMGEPLANYENAIKSIKTLLSPWAFNFSHRKITLSTAGLINRMQQLGHDVPINLAISLNAPNDTIRNFLMPINKQFPIHDLINAAKKFPLASRKRITFEYILIKGINDSPDNARELARLLKNINCKINLIPFNEHPAIKFKSPDEHRIAAFQTILHSLHFTAPIRRSKGSDIAAACGQLGGRIKQED
ncbi:MAG: 23S rRNA (adenine(2503)-C(2))-methyltransferase RlmN [Pseudomonadota bacterium]